jgi:uncharacterized membrane protein YdjX (TVP38/TMEM64 family)
MNPLPKRFSAKFPVSLLLGAALLCAFLLVLVMTYGAGSEALLARASTFYAFARNHVWLLLGLYVVRLLFFLPASLVIVLTGMMCGAPEGECLGVLGLALGGSIEFLLVRSTAASALSRVSNSLLQNWRQRINQAPFHAVLLMRICFVPFDAVNITAAVAGAPFRPFFLATLLGVIPTTLPLIVAGASIDFDSWVASGRLWPGEGTVHWPYVGLSVVLAALIVLHARRSQRRLPAPAEAELQARE